MLRQTFGCVYQRKVLQKRYTGNRIGKITGVINKYLEDDALPFALANKKYRLVVITARARGLVAFENIWLQKLGLVTCYVFNYFSRNNIYHFADRVVFYNGAKPPLLFSITIPRQLRADK